MKQKETRSVPAADREERLRSKHQQSLNEMMLVLFDLNTERKRLKTVLNCMTSGVMVTNEHLEIVLHNPAFIKLMDIREEIQMPVPVHRIIQDACLIDALRKIQSGAFDMDASISQEIRTQSRVLRTVSAPALGPDRNVFWTVTGAVTLFEDITAFKQLNQMK
ncbi:MAG: PAS domain-containing protein [Deltaproteobacteria bacterium]|nr:PAS domain-containing protein [Deltaproteobacteria bacterium]